MLSGNYKAIYKLLAVLFLALNSTTSRAQYIIEGAKYRSIRDSLLNSGKSIQPTDLINSISISGQIKRPGGPYHDPNPLLWEKAEPLVGKYQGRKIRRILVQHSSGKAIIFLKGSDPISTTKYIAEKDGLLPKTSYNASEIVKIDSPLYIGDRIPVHIKKQNPENKLAGVQAGIRSTGIPYEYELQSYLPGDIWILEMGTAGRTKKVYAYHALKEPAEHPTGPDFFPGEIRSTITDYNYFKNQDRITVTNGYQFSGGTLYFSGTGFSNVSTCTISGPSLAPAKIFIDQCMPGSNIMFDNVSVLDPAGKKIMLDGKSFVLIDNLDIRDNYSGLISYPDFTGGDIAFLKYIIETLIRLPDAGLTKGKFDLNYTFIVEPDGTLTDMYGKDFYSKNKLGQICYRLIKNSQMWIPGTYKGENVSMISNIYFSIEIK